MLENKGYSSRDNTPVVRLGQILKVPLRMQTHFRVVLPLLTRLCDYCCCFDLTKSVSVDDLSLCSLLFWFCKSGRSEHGVSFAWTCLSIRENGTVVPVQKLGNDWSDDLVEHFCLAVLIQYHVKRSFQVVVQIWLDCDVLVECLYYVFVTKFDLGMQWSHTHCHLQSFVQGLANLLLVW